jgi:hypothetical protein
MKKRLKQLIAVWAFIPCFFVVEANAQFSLGIEGGYAKNYLITNVSNLVSTQYNPLGGVSIGVPVEYQVADWFAVKAAPSFTQKNYQMQRTGFYQGIYQNNTNGYVQLPVMGQFSFGGEAFRGFVDLGGYSGYWLTGHVKGTMPDILEQPAYTNNISNAQPNNVFDEYTAYNYNEKYTFNTTRDRRLELGVLAGAGVSYQVNDNYKIFAEATYYDGLSDLQKNYEQGLVPRYNATFIFSVGVLFSLGGSSTGY